MQADFSLYGLGRFTTLSGPPPKLPAIRQRQNRTPGATTLNAEGSPKRRPGLPQTRELDGETVAWRTETVAWWRDLWRSPMASEFLRSDLHRLLLLAVLVDDFWRCPSTKLASEIRLQGQCFGLTPIDRRRLQWEVQPAEAEGVRRLPSPPPAVDPRRALHAV